PNRNVLCQLPDFVFRKKFISREGEFGKNKEMPFKVMDGVQDGFKITLNFSNHWRKLKIPSTDLGHHHPTKKSGQRWTLPASSIKLRLYDYLTSFKCVTALFACL